MNAETIVNCQAQPYSCESPKLSSDSYGTVLQKFGTQKCSNSLPNGVLAKVGEVPTVRSSDTDADLPTVSADLFHEF
jgi:hypothetical protein